MCNSDYINLTQITGKPPQTTYPFKTTPRWLSCKHLNDCATKAPNINSKIITCTFIKCSPNNLQHKNVLVWLADCAMLRPLILQEGITVSNVEPRKTDVKLRISSHKYILPWQQWMVILKGNWFFGSKKINSTKIQVPLNTTISFKHQEHLCNHINYADD